MTKHAFIMPVWAAETFYILFMFFLCSIGYFTTVPMAHRADGTRQACYGGAGEAGGAACFMTRAPLPLHNFSSL